MLKISFTGYIGANCNQKHVGEQVAITFSVAVTNQYKNRQGETISNTTWVGCTIWRKPEHTRIAEFLKKGQQVYVEGEPSARAWISNADQTAKCMLDCRVNSLELLGKSAAGTQTNHPNSTEQSPATAPATNTSDNDDLPF